MEQSKTVGMTLLGCEAVALGATDAGLSIGYGYPGTPSTEILETLLRHSGKPGKPRAIWATNEKTAYEEALGVSMAGKRTIITMKHVGLNVAADPFMNSAMANIHGGLVLAVADDPGMHSSQNEQDSRYYADFARTICLEPADPQEAYDMTREAFNLSEQYKVPVVLRLVTRLAHGRAQVLPRDARAENPLNKTKDRAGWILMPANSRRLWKRRIGLYQELAGVMDASPFNKLELDESNRELGVITTGIARHYFAENLGELDHKPSHLHIGSYPIPMGLVRKLLGHVKRVLILEEGYPYVERFIRGVLPPAITILGKESREVQPDGELTPEIVRKALGLPERKGLPLPKTDLPNRPPQLCQGCPHCDTFSALLEAVEPMKDRASVTSDIGCYTLGALPPYNAIESCICMGASITMAKGLSDAGIHPAVAVLGDSTFLHSGMTGLVDAVSANTPMTVFILDNEAVAMTGGQTTILPSKRLHTLVQGIGVNPEHFHVINAHRKDHAANVALIRKELEHRGLSVIIAVRECLETAKRKKKGAQ